MIQYWDLICDPQRHHLLQLGHQVRFIVQPTGRLFTVRLPGRNLQLLVAAAFAEEAGDRETDRDRPDKREPFVAKQEPGHCAETSVLTGRI